jgi:hypothetical protein
MFFKNIFPLLFFSFVHYKQIWNQLPSLSEFQFFKNHFIIFLSTSFFFKLFYSISKLPIYIFLPSSFPLTPFMNFVCIWFLLVFFSLSYCSVFLRTFTFSLICIKYFCFVCFLLFTKFKKILHFSVSGGYFYLL